MTNQTRSNPPDDIIATIENKDNPSQSIALRYLSDENAFVTSGIQTHFGEKELFIPSYLVVTDFALMGTIVSAILEELSKARDMESTFEYASTFEVLNKKYTMTEYGEYMKLEQKEEENQTQ